MSLCIIDIFSPIILRFMQRYIIFLAIEGVKILLRKGMWHWVAMMYAVECNETRKFIQQMVCSDDRMTIAALQEAGWVAICILWLWHCAGSITAIEFPRWMYVFVKSKFPTGYDSYSAWCAFLEFNIRYAVFTAHITGDISSSEG